MINYKFLILSSLFYHFILANVYWTCRSNMHFSSSGGLSPSNREGIDPIAELLSQLSGVRRSGGGSGQSTSAPTQLQQLQMQLQLERQQVRV